MRQFTNRASGPQRPQPFDDAKPTRSAVYGGAGNIQRQNMVVFMQNDVRQRRHFCKCGDTASSSRSATRTGSGLTDFIARFSLYSGLMRFCSPHLAFTQMR